MITQSSQTYIFVNEMPTEILKTTSPRLFCNARALHEERNSVTIRVTAFDMYTQKYVPIVLMLTYM